MGDDLLSGVSRWLETSGHAFELRVARAFREAAASTVDLSFTYTDSTTDALREGDVLAQFEWTSLNTTPAVIEVVAECKSSRDHPWVALYDKPIARGGRLAEWVYNVHGPFTGVTEPLEQLWRGWPPFDAERIASHLVAAHEKDSRNPANDALRQVLSAAEGRWQRYLARQTLERRGCVIIPVVVTAAPLVQCHLDEAGTMHVQLVSSAVVSGPRQGDQPARVFVLNETAVKPFARNIAQLAQLAHEHTTDPF